MASVDFYPDKNAQVLVAFIDLSRVAIKNDIISKYGILSLLCLALNAILNVYLICLEEKNW